MNFLNSMSFLFLIFAFLKLLQIVKHLENRIEKLESEKNEGGVN